MNTQTAYQQCINPTCGATFDLGQRLFGCPHCSDLLDVRYQWDQLPTPESLTFFEQRWGTRGSASDFSGVWRFRDLLPFAREEDIVTIGEGRTVLQPAYQLAERIGHAQGHLFLQYEGLNPSGSFKDNGMTAAFTHARMVGARRVACASTGNTSASLALFSHISRMQGIVFIGSGKIAVGKLSQALDYGAITLQITGDFDACLRRVREVAASPQLGVYLMNSVNPFRLEGQKSIMYRVLEARDWEVPDWIIVPGGNLGNCSAFGKAFMELAELGLIHRIPRLAIVNATGANTLSRLVNQDNMRWNGGRVDAAPMTKLYREFDQSDHHPSTIASAIEISRPVNLKKALRAIEVTDGVVREVSDEQILEAKAQIGLYGYGCEPASAASLAGLQMLKKEQLIGRNEDVVCILTGHQLKDPNATVKYHTGVDLKAAMSHAPKAETRGRYSNAPIQVDDDLETILEALGLSQEEIQRLEATSDATPKHVPVSEY